MNVVGQRWHLVRRAFGSLSNSAPDRDDLVVVREVLSEAEYSLWREMDGRDQRHSLHVLTRFDALLPGAPRQWRAAALLHDVGKSASSLGWSLRVLATLVGSRPGRFAAYHEHERLGAEMLRGISDPETVSLVGGGGHPRAMKALAEADNI